MGVGTHLVVEAVQPGGTVESWNRFCEADKIIQPGDSIMQVNGQSEVGAMLAECHNQHVLTLNIVRGKGTDTDVLEEDAEEHIEVIEVGRSSLSAAAPEFVPGRAVQDAANEDLPWFCKMEQLAQADSFSVLSVAEIARDDYQQLPDQPASSAMKVSFIKPQPQAATAEKLVAFLIGKPGKADAAFDKKVALLRSLAQKKKLVLGLKLDAEVVEKAVGLASAQLELS